MDNFKTFVIMICLIAAAFTIHSLYDLYRANKKYKIYKSKCDRLKVLHDRGLSAIDNIKSINLKLKKFDEPGYLMKYTNEQN